jgi:hypothetical protein
VGCGIVENARSKTYKCSVTITTGSVTSGALFGPASGEVRHTDDTISNNGRDPHARPCHCYTPYLPTLAKNTSRSPQSDSPKQAPPPSIELKQYAQWLCKVHKTHYKNDLHMVSHPSRDLYFAYKTKKRNKTYILLQTQ